MVGNSNELLRREVVLAGPKVEVTERVDGVPVLGLFVDQTNVQLDRSVELSQASSLSACFRVASRSIATGRLTRWEKEEDFPVPTLPSYQTARVA